MRAAVFTLYRIKQRFGIVVVETLFLFAEIVCKIIIAIMVIIPSFYAVLRSGSYQMRQCYVRPRERLCLRFGGMVNFVAFFASSGAEDKTCHTVAFSIDMVYIAVAWRRYSAGMSGGRE